MLRILAASAILGLALGQGVEYSSSVSEEIDIWDVGYKNDANVKISASLIARVAAIESSSVPFQASVDLAGSSMARVDAIVAEVAAIKTAMIIDVTALKTRLKVAANQADLSHHQDVAVARQTAILQAGRAARQAMIDELEVGKAHMKVLLPRLTKKLDATMPALKKTIADNMEEILSRIPFHHSDDHIEQVTGFRPEEIEKYWDGKVIKSKAANADVVNRLFYKIVFNARNPGYWTSGSDEMFMACLALSSHLYRKDGIERDLRPACNHWGNWNIGGMGQCIKIADSYFSHCGGSNAGYWRMEQACGGVPEETLRNTISYEDATNNHDRHLIHNAPNNHYWSDPYQKNEKTKFVLCTGGNQNFKK
jgi:hypothetical protein